MFLKKCACGAQSKNFNSDIGSCFIDQCCLDAGYDIKGNKVKSSDDQDSNKEDAKTTVPADVPKAETKSERKAREKAEKEAALAKQNEGSAEGGPQENQ